MRAGLKESLAGRFEVLPCTHWSWKECRDCFHWTLDQYLYFGGYPGSAELIGDEARWARYIRESLIEPTISRDVLLLHRVEKPNLMHRLFHLACESAGQILSYNKMLGQLTDAGNTTTLAHYQRLLEQAYLLRGLPRWTGAAVGRRASSPKWTPLNTALITSISGRSFEDWRNSPDLWGRLVESAVGAHLVNSSFLLGSEVYYWRERNWEVDYVVKMGDKLVGIEVKTSRLASPSPGMAAFQRRFNPLRMLLVGGTGVPLEEFMELAPSRLFHGSEEDKRGHHENT